MVAIRLSAFADEVSADPREQVQALQAQRIAHLELRGVWDTGVLELTDSRVRELRTLLEDAGIRISALGSPIGKISIRGDLASHFQLFQLAVERAQQFSTRYIRVFSFYHPGEEAAACRPVVLETFQRMVDYAASEDVILLHENEKDIYGDVPERCLDLLRTVDSPHLRATFDPANFIQSGADPLAQAWPQLAPYVHSFHIKDAQAATGRVVPAGHGDAGMASLLKQAMDRGFDGFLSVEPHLAAADPEYGGTCVARFATAVSALRQLLEHMDVVIV